MSFLIQLKTQRNFAIAEWQFRTKLKRNLSSANEISLHNANTAFFAILDRKRGNNLSKKADIYQYSIEIEQNEVALLTEKTFESAAQFKCNKF